MKKYLPLAVVLVLLIGAGLYWHSRQTSMPPAGMNNNSTDAMMAPAKDKGGMISSIKDAMGLGDVFMQAITHTAPATAILFTIPFITSKAGMASPISYFFAFLIILIMGVTLTQLAKHLPSAGGYYTYVSHTINPRAGFLTSQQTLDNLAGVAAGIAMFNFTAIHDRDGLEASMRMLTDAATFVGRLKDCGSGVVQKQEGSGLSCVFVCENGAHGKAVADPMPLRGRARRQRSLEQGQSRVGFLFFGSRCNRHLSSLQ